jgi:hypothetical protein
MSLVELDARGLQVGSEIVVKWHRPQGATPMKSGIAVLRMRKPPATPKPQPWQRVPKVAFGPEVARDERKQYIAAMSAHPRMTALGKNILARLALHYDSDDGAYPSYKSLARDIRRCKRHTIREVDKLEWIGCLEVVKNAGKKTESGWTNRFVMRWPDGWPLPKKKR